ncbi:MAG: ABC transporter permease, partial [Chloroflexota bacterium]
LKNALIVVVTLVGVQFGNLLGGAVVVEEVFAIPGSGRMLLTAIVQRDYALVQGAVLAIALLFVSLNIVVDLLYGYIDPRVRLA